eukprot:1142018-Pelagomonas_calceolata.AAC.4
MALLLSGFARFGLLVPTHTTDFHQNLCVYLMRCPHAHARACVCVCARARARVPAPAAGGLPKF